MFWNIPDYFANRGTFVISRDEDINGRLLDGHNRDWQLKLDKSAYSYFVQSYYHKTISNIFF